MSGLVTTLRPARLRLPDISVLARLADAVAAARARARVRRELRHVLNANARLRRDLGLSRLDVLRMTTED